MAEILATLRELAHICRDGERLYSQAAADMRNARLREVAGEVARVRGELFLEFAALLGEHGRRCEGGSLYGRLRKRYAGLRARFSDRDRVYVFELENMEDRLLHAMERASLCQHAAGETRALLRRHMPAARAAHERMRELKRELAKAAA